MKVEKQLEVESPFLKLTPDDNWHQGTDHLIVDRRRIDAITDSGSEGGADIFINGTAFHVEESVEEVCSKLSSLVRKGLLK